MRSRQMKLWVNQPNETETVWQQCRTRAAIRPNSEPWLTVARAQMGNARQTAFDLDSGCPLVRLRVHPISSIKTSTTAQRGMPVAYPAAARARR